MLCSLPRTFDFAPSGQAVPEDPDPKLIGQNVQLDRFASADAMLKQRLDEKVVVPLEAWLSAFQDIQVPIAWPVVEHCGLARCARPLALYLSGRCSENTLRRWLGFCYRKGMVTLLLME